MWRRVALVRTVVLEELIFSIIRVKTISKLKITLSVTDKWRTLQYISPKRRFLQQPHGVTSQKTALFMVTAVKTSILKTKFNLWRRLCIFTNIMLPNLFDSCWRFEKCATFIVSVDEKAKHAVSCYHYSKTSLSIYHTTRPYILIVKIFVVKTIRTSVFTNPYS
jgi:hypothetical protein